MQHNFNPREKNRPSGPTIDLDSNQLVQTETWYMGKVSAHKPIKRSIVHGVFRAALVRYGNVAISEAEADILLFNFERQEVANQILDRSLWSMNGHILNIK